MRELLSIKYVKSIFNSPTKKRLVENFVSLSSLQMVGYILPLITLPYLVRVLGPEKFGLISFAQAFISYFAILTDYGFNLSATREISINRDNKEKVAEIFFSVMMVKILLGTLSFFVLALVLVFIPKFRSDWLVYVFSFGMVVGNIMFPIWFFQGMERIKYITVLVIISRLILTVAIFIFVRKVDDYFYVPLLNSFGYIIAGVLSLWVVFRNFKIKFILPSSRNLKHQLNEGWHIFISTVAISLYTTSNAFVLGLFTNNTVVGYYSATEKIVRVVQYLFAPISQSTYPYISKLVSESKKHALNFIVKIAILIGGFSFFISLLIFLFASSIIKIILGSQYQQAVIVLQILSFLPFIISLSNIFAVQGLYAFKFQKTVSMFVVPIAVIHVFLLIILIHYYSLVGLAVAVVVTEILITIFSIKYFYKFIYKKNHAIN